MKKILLTLIISAALFSLAAFIEAPSAEINIKLRFVDHLEAGMIEQDVFVQKSQGVSNVYRVLPEEREAYLNSLVYTTGAAHHHDPLNRENIGPFDAGESLDMTLEEWLGGSGTASYSCEDGWGNLTAAFEKLVPNSTYTMWHFFMAMPPTKPFTGTLDLPVGERDGSQSKFETDQQGNAGFNATFQPCLQLGGDQLGSGLAIAWHSDGETYGVTPGGFGNVTHVQMFAMLPNERDETAK